jgi:hypothetical protein
LAGGGFFVLCGIFGGGFVEGVGLFVLFVVPIRNFNKN